MKRILSLLALFAIALTTQPVLAASLAAQVTGGNSAHLTWTASTSAGGTVTVYRAAGDCASATGFAAIASKVVAAGPYDDTTVSVGSSVGQNSATYCYYVTAVVNSAESGPSNKIALTFTNTVLPQPPTGLAGTAN